MAGVAEQKLAGQLREQRGKLLIQLGELQTVLAQKYGPVAGQVYNPARIRESLAEHMALVGWLDLKASPKAADPNGEHWGCILRARGEPVWIKLPGTGPQGAWTEADDQLPEQVREMLAGRESLLAGARGWQEPAGKLFQQRLAPLVKHLGPAHGLPAVKHLIVLPSPAMRAIPLEALLAGNKDLATLTISYAPSGTLYAWLQEQRYKAGKDEQRLRLLALGDPTFARPEVAKKTSSLLALDRGEFFQPLPGTRHEVEAIAGLFPETVKLLGSQASEEKLEQLAGQGRLKEFRYLHLATHGLIDGQQPLRSYLALAQDKLPDPLARSLAGKAPYTGQLSAAHILGSWKLDADLVVLSACKSGLGKYEGGEGYVGFAQALLLSGARSLVLSQWPVDDEATALLMTRFYGNLLGRRPGAAAPRNKPLPKALALQEARNWLRHMTVPEAEKEIALLPAGVRGALRIRPRGTAKAARPYQHPYYWAAFILIGQPE